MLYTGGLWHILGGYIIHSGLMLYTGSYVIHSGVMSYTGGYVIHWGVCHTLGGGAHFIHRGEGVMTQRSVL